MKDTKLKLSRITVALHWIVGLTIIAMTALGIYMGETETYSLYDIHKSIGMLILSVILVRVVWRIMNGWPEPVSVYSNIEQKLSKLVHWVLVISTIVMPVSGIIMSGAGGHGLNIFGLEILAHNPDLVNIGKVIPLNGNLAEIGHEFHEIVSSVMIGAIVLHIAGALKHHIIDKDGTLRRMLGAKTS